MLAALAGCGDGGSSDDDAPVVLTAADLHVLGTSDSIAVVEDLTVLDDGTVWVLNSVEPLYLAFDDTGGPVAAHGRRGGGPEEHGAPSGFVAGGLEGEAWVLDRRRHALVRASAPERARAEVTLPREDFPVGSVLGGDILRSRIRTARLGGEVVVPRRTEAGEIRATTYWLTMWNAELVALDPETGRVRTLLSLPDVVGDMEARHEEIRTGMPPFPLWQRHWAVCGDREIRLYDPIRDQVRGFAPDGAELEPIRPPPPPVPRTSPEEFARAAFDLAAAERAGAATPEVGSMSAEDSARLIRSVVSRVEASPDQLAAHLPQYVDLRCDDEGTLWLRPLDLQAGGLRGGPGWLRVAPDGGVREIRFPARFDPYVFAQGRAWGVARDVMDVASVAYVELP